MTRFLPAALCRLIGHRRSRRRAYIDPERRVWRSYCRRCGTPMKRHGLYGWREDAETGRKAA